MTSLAKWVVFSAAWMIAGGFIVPGWPWLNVAAGALLGFISLVFFDSWRGRREDRELRERFLKSSRR